MYPESIPRSRRYFCKACLQRGTRVYMDDIGGSRIRCSVCGRTVVRPDRRGPVLRSADPVRFRTGGGRTREGGSEWTRGERSWDGRVDSYKPCGSVGRNIYRERREDWLIKPEAEVFDTPDEFLILVTLPYHKGLENIKCEIHEKKLILKSLVTNYSQEFSLPETSGSLKKTFKNGILTLSFKKG